MNLLRLFFLCLALCSASVARADWPDFRGPWADGHVSAPGDTNLLGLPLHWSETNHVKWKTSIPHKGWSTPVILGNQIWLTTATDEVMIFLPSAWRLTPAKFSSTSRSFIATIPSRSATT